MKETSVSLPFSLWIVSLSNSIRDEIKDFLMELTKEWNKNKMVENHYFATSNELMDLSGEHEHRRCSCQRKWKPDIGVLEAHDAARILRKSGPASGPRCQRAGNTLNCTERPPAKSRLWRPCTSSHPDPSRDTLGEKGTWQGEGVEEWGAVDLKTCKIKTC